MDAIVLVGGEGTRLRPLTLTTPKQLLPVAGVPMLERVLGSLGRAGVERAVLSLGYRPDSFLAAYPDGEAAGVRLAYAVEPTPMDTAGAIAFAADEAGVAGAVLVVNGDVLTDLDVAALVAFHHRREALATIALTPVEDPSRFGVVPTDDEGRVVAFVEKPPRETAPTNQINAGTYVLEPEVLAGIPRGRRVSLERETFPALAGEGRLFALSSDTYWLDTGTPEAYVRANLDVISGIRGPMAMAGAEERSPGVWAARGVDVKGLELKAPVLLGAGVVLDRGAVVAGSVLGSGAGVGEGASVVGSVLLPGARVEAGAKVVSSVLGCRAMVGAGAIVEDLTVVGDDQRVSTGARHVGERIPAGAG